MFVRKSKYEALKADMRLAESERRYRNMEGRFHAVEIENLKNEIEGLNAVIADQLAQIAELQTKELKIVNEQSKKFIEVEHASIKAMNAAIPKLRKQGWSDKLKVKIQGDKVFTVHEREVKENK